jgi:hypothetical protein
MMNGTEFFKIIVPTAMGFIGLTALLGIFRRGKSLDAAERAGLWLSLELGLMTTIFALLPFPLFYSFDTATASELFVWRLGSLLLVVYLTLHLFVVNDNRRRFRAQYPEMMRLLLVLSGIFLTMEFVNAIWWGSMAGYTWGVLWLLALSGIQLIAFVCYDRQTTLLSGFSAYRQPVVDQRVRGVERAGDSNRPPVANANDHGSGNRLNRDPYRYTDDNAVYSYRRSVSDATVRTHTDLLKRRHNSDPNSQS